MRLRKHARMIVAVFSIFCVVFAVALHVQVSPGATGQTLEQAAKPTASSAPTTPAGPDDTETQGARPTQSNSSEAELSASEGAVSVPAANADTHPASEELQRQANAAIPRAEQPKIAPDAKYEPGVVLISVRKGTTAEQLSQAITDASIQSVEPNDIETVTDDLMMAKLAQNATIDNAIYELESTGIAKSAQPNYIYEIAEEPTTTSDGTELPLAATGALGNTATANSADSAHNANAKGQLDAQSTSPTAARDALNDTYAKQQWNLDSIDAYDAWEFPPLKNAAATVGVGILDNGFNDSHEDLAGNVRSTYNATTKAENVPVPCPPGTPNANHGIHVAGIVAATSNNEKGIGGVGFNHLKLSLVSLTRESNPSGITTDDVVTGFDYLINHKDQYNIRVASISLGVKVDSIPPKDDAILKKVDEAYGKGIVTVASAGNRTANAIPPYINYPSDYETVVSVINLRNTNSDDPKSVTISDTSNFNAQGETSKNISAPGTNIYSTYPNGYGEMSGTSMAAPHVTSVVGLMFAVNPMMKADQAKNLLYNNARDIGATGWDATFGYGEVNAFAAIRAAADGTIEGPGFLAVGSQATYTAGSDYADFSFSSSNPRVLEVSENGNATAKSAGIAVVRASNGNATITHQVTVLGPITGNNLVAKNGSEELAITTPAGCGSLAWNWSSSDESVATVTGNGVVHGQDVGNATITATLVSDETVTLRRDVTVYAAKQRDEYVPVGSTITLTPDTSGLTEPQIIWSSTNKEVATVENGTVTALRAGGTVVSCTIGQGDQSVTNVWCVYVYGPIEGDSRVGIGQSTQLSVTGISDMPKEFQSGWTWSLGTGSDSTVATISADGIVTGHKLGTVTVTATRGSGQEQASLSYAMEVTPASLADAKVTIPKQTYSGQKLTPVPVVTLNGTTLVAGTDYDLVDQEIVNAGSHTVTIQGKNNYQGETTGIFIVEPLKLTPPKAVTGLVYNGLPQTGVPAGAGYTLEDATKTDADDYFATAVVTDKVNTCWEGNNSTSCRIAWSIKERPASEVSVTVPGSYVYNGKAHTPEPTVTWNGAALKEDDDYTVSYTNNVNAGTATVTITCEYGNFTGTKTATFTIEPAAASVGTVTAADVKDSLNPADVVLTRTDTSLTGQLAITETELSYGTNTYHWTFTPADANHKPSSGTVEVTVTGHEWGAPTYTWAEGDTSCTAKRVCANNPAHVEEETVVPSRKVSVEPTTDSEGKATLTSEFKNTAFTAQSKEVALSKLPESDAASSSAQDGSSSQSGTTNNTRASSGQGGSTKAAPSGTKSDSNRLVDTSDNTWPIASIAVAGMALSTLTALFALAALRRRSRKQ